MPKRDESLANILILAPWWISVVLAFLSYGALRWLLPAYTHGKPVLESFGIGGRGFAPYAAGMFLMLSVLSFIFGLKRRSLVNRQNSLETLRELSWKEFEWMVGEALRRQGYEVEESFGGGADGGVDLVLRKGGQTTIVQCKQWKVNSVGAPVVRELFGIMTADKADAAMVITSGKFTRDAEAFAAGKPIQLIDGPALLALVQGVQPNAAPKQEQRDPVPPSAPACPKCGALMVLRTAGKGANAGNQFWGCSGYPKCRCTLNLSGS